MKKNEILRPLVNGCARTNGDMSIKIPVINFLLRAVRSEVFDMEKIMMVLVYIHACPCFNHKTYEDLRKYMGYTQDLMDGIVEYLIENRLVYAEIVDKRPWEQGDMFTDWENTDKKVRKCMDFLDNYLAK